MEINENEKLVLDRLWKKEGYTIGNLSYCGRFVCNTLEPQWRDYAAGEKKVYGRSAIPAGTYRVVICQSRRLRMLCPRLLFVPHFSGILIHPGNTKEDTKGCILVGLNKERGKVLQSRATFERVFDIVEKGQKKGAFYIEINDLFYQ